MTVQFYFRLKTDQNPLSVYSKGPFNRNYDCIMAICRYLNYLDFNLDINLDSFSLDWINYAFTAISCEANEFVKSLINKFASYEDNALSAYLIGMRYDAACKAVWDGNIKLFKWFLQNNEPIDGKLISSSVYNDESIKLLLPMLDAAEQFKVAIVKAIWFKRDLSLILKEAASHHITDMVLRETSIEMCLKTAVKSVNLEIVKYVVETLGASHRLNFKFIESLERLAIGNNHQDIVDYLKMRHHIENG